MKIYIIGGIGDFLQCLDAVINLKNSSCSFVVVTHYKQAPDFFGKYADLNKFSFYYFNSLAELHQINCGLDFKDLIICPRSAYFEEKCPYEVQSPFDNDNEIIGIHPFGSSFSQSAHTQLKFSQKKLSKNLVDSLIKPDKNYFIFGSPAETTQYSHYDESPNVCIISHPDIWVSLSHVQLCKKVIAVDSSIKTMALSKKIKTYLILGDFKDETRDSLFINPYLNSGLLDILKVSDPEKNEKEIAKYIEEKVYRNN